MPKLTRQLTQGEVDRLREMVSKAKQVHEARMHNPDTSFAHIPVWGIRETWLDYARLDGRVHKRYSPVYTQNFIDIDRLVRHIDAFGPEFIELNDGEQEAVAIALTWEPGDE